MRYALASLTLLVPVMAVACPQTSMKQAVLQQGMFKAADGTFCNADVTYPVLESAHGLAEVNGDILAQAQQSRCPGVKTNATVERSDESQFSGKVIADQHPIYTVALTTYHYPNGAAHGMYHTDYITLNKMTGKPFGYYDMVDTSQLPAINAYIRQELASREDTADYIEFAKDESREYLGTKGCDGCAFGADAEGVFVQFGLYDVAPYSSGEVKIYLPQAFVPNEDLHHIYAKGA